MRRVAVWRQYRRMKVIAKVAWMRLMDSQFCCPFPNRRQTEQKTKAVSWFFTFARCCISKIDPFYKTACSTWRICSITDMCGPWKTQEDLDSEEKKGSSLCSNWVLRQFTWIQRQKAYFLCSEKQGKTLSKFWLCVFWRYSQIRPKSTPRNFLASAVNFWGKKQAKTCV